MTDWLNDAPCRGLPAEWWYPAKEDSNGPRYVRAKQICAECPYQTPCFHMGLEQEASRTRHGYWGGTTPEQREEHERARRAAERQAS